MRLVILVAASALSVLPAAAQQSAAPVTKPYPEVPIVLPPPTTDPDFDLLRQQFTDAADRQERAALSRLVVEHGFSWQRENGNGADPCKDGLANYAAAIGLGNSDGSR
jgi:hypothetical protein